MLSGFLRQPIRAHRDSWIVLGLVGGHFFAAALAVVLFPWSLLDRFRYLGEPIGQWYAVSEYSHLWRMLAVGALLSLGANAFALAANPLRCRPLLISSATATLGAAGGLAWIWAATYRFAPLLGVALWLVGAFALLVWAHERAYRAISSAGCASRSELRPRLVSSDGLSKDKRAESACLDVRGRSDDTSQCVHPVSRAPSDEPGCSTATASTREAAIGGGGCAAVDWHLRRAHLVLSDRP